MTIPGPAIEETEVSVVQARAVRLATGLYAPLSKVYWRMSIAFGLASVLAAWTMRMPWPLIKWSILAAALIGMAVLIVIITVG